MSGNKNSNLGKKNALDKDLRGYLETNADILTVIEKPVSIQMLHHLFNYL